MNFSIRLATRNDMPAVHALIRELAVFEKEADAVEISVADLERDGFSALPKFKTFVAEEQKDIIGMALFYERYSTWKGKAIHLEDLIVTRSKRKLGVGRALYKALMLYAAKNNFNRVAWEAISWNKTALDFYEKSGAYLLKDWRILHMDKEGLKTFIDKNN